MGSPTGKEAMANRRTRARVMNTMHHRLNELAVRQSTSQPVQLGCQTSSLNHSNRASPAEADPHTSSCKFHAAMQPCSRLPSLTHSRAAATHLMLSTPTHANEKQLLQQQACSKCNAATYNLSHVLQSQKQTLQAPTQLSHRDVLQQGIVQLRQRLAKEREDNIAAQMRLARASFVRNAPCRCY